ncbi:MAG: hypothetical protein K6G10_10655 [Butyrivibrio sp.]|nr:hypothetical protein [Butyrivibrio sp.]
METPIMLKKNTLMENGICIYEDLFGNTVFMQKKGDDDKTSFVAKLRFKNEKIKAQPLYITIPVSDDEKGTMLHLDYLDGAEKSGEDIDSAIKMLTQVVQRWINMMYDINAMKIGVDSEKTAKERLESLSEYEELSDLVGILMKQ